MPGEILADNQAAVEELLAVAKEEVLGFPRLRIEGKGFDAVVEELTEDEVLVSGGKAEAGGFSAVLRSSDFKRGEPEQFDSIEARGMSLQILSVRRSISNIVVTAGDPARE